MIEAPIILIAMVFAARCLRRRYAIPPALGRRALVGPSARHLPFAAMPALVARGVDSRAPRR